MKSSKNRPPQLVRIAPPYLNSFTNEDSLWHESPEEIVTALAQSARNAKRLTWVRKTMTRKLTPRERRCVQLYYFEGHSLREVGELTKTNTTSAQRAIQRAIVKLRRASENLDKRIKIPESTKR